jgi:antirestriction protein ArdC
METIITRDVYAIVTNLIIQLLEQGTVPWRQPWCNTGLPRNLVTQRPYRGINYLLLSSLNYAFNDFLTFKQVQDLGGRVKKGEKAHLVSYWVWNEPPKTTELDIKARNVPALRYYHVFNLDQCTGILENITPLPDKVNTPLEVCESIVANMPNRAKILHNENEAYYLTPADFINMPKMNMFESSEAYYGTLFHELIHSTGYVDRLNRKELMDMPTTASESYSIEELTAEIGASYLASYADISIHDLKNSAAYISHWLDRLKQDKRFVVYASVHAQKAVDYILDIKHHDNETISHLQNETI